MYPKKKLYKTKFLFSYPLMSAVNPHQILDDVVPNYIIIIKMKSKNEKGQNYLMALYSERPLSNNTGTNNGLGFISSVTNRATFFLRNGTASNPRVTEYNQFFIIFGNAEVRFRLDSRNMEFNIGHLYKSFDTKEHKTPMIFTGSEDVMAEMEGYEIYQLLFE